MSSGLFIGYLIVSSISLCSITAQIIFNDGEGKPAEVVDQKNENQDDQQDNSANLDDYYDEVANGHRIRDPDKHKRQEGCLCNHQLQDPHCGSDLKMYDNGCYFECAQKRNPRLNLRNWGPCL